MCELSEQTLIINEELKITDSIKIKVIKKLILINEIQMQMDTGIDVQTSLNSLFKMLPNSEQTPQYKKVMHKHLSEPLFSYLLIQNIYTSEQLKNMMILDVFKMEQHNPLWKFNEKKSKTYSHRLKIPQSVLHNFLTKELNLRIIQSDFANRLVTRIQKMLPSFYPSKYDNDENVSEFNLKQQMEYYLGDGFSEINISNPPIPHDIETAYNRRIRIIEREIHQSFKELYFDSNGSNKTESENKMEIEYRLLDMQYKKKHYDEQKLKNKAYIEYKWRTTHYLPQMRQEIKDIHDYIEGEWTVYSGTLYDSPVSKKTIYIFLNTQLKLLRPDHYMIEHGL
jgi:hypothetical protein